MLNSNPTPLSPPAFWLYKSLVSSCWFRCRGSICFGDGLACKWLLRLSRKREFPLQTLRLDGAWRPSSLAQLSSSRRWKCTGYVRFIRCQDMGGPRTNTSVQIHCIRTIWMCSTPDTPLYSTPGIPSASVEATILGPCNDFAGILACQKQKKGYSRPRPCDPSKVHSGDGHPQHFRLYIRWIFFLFE